MPGARVALTGIPGSGKTTVADAVARLRPDVRVMRLNDVARDAGLLAEMDEARGSFVVDMDALAERVNALLDAHDGPAVIEGHFAHEMDVDAVVLLRVDPLVLVPRLNARGWPEAKVRENVEAEALDVLAAEVLETELPAIELDASHRSVEELAREVAAIADAGPKGLKGAAVGTARWQLESLPWF